MKECMVFRSDESEVEDDTRALRQHLDIAQAERTAEEERLARLDAAEKERRFEELLRTVHNR
ncbi:MAG: hypothetical protein NVS3B21_36090 [Acidimicrobiales bacterium]